MLRLDLVIFKPCSSIIVSSWLRATFSVMRDLRLALVAFTLLKFLTFKPVSFLDIPTKLFTLVFREKASIFLYLPTYFAEFLFETLILF